MAAHQASPSLGFSRHEHWSGLPFPSPVHVCILSHFSHVWLCATLWTAANQVPLSTGFSRQEYWSGLPFPSPSMQLTSCKMLGWMKHKPESRMPGEISIPQICRWHHPYGRKWRTKEPLDESERGEWKSWLKAQHSENEDHGILSHHFMGNRCGNNENSVRLYFWGAPKSLQMVIAAMKLKDAYSLEGKLWPT